MDPKDDATPFEELFEQLADLLQFTVENMDKPLEKELPKDLNKQLDKLEKEVALFCNLNKEIIAETPPEERPKNLDHLSKRERATIARCDQLKKEAYEKLALLPKDVPATSVPKTDNEQQKRAKRMNRKQKWKSL